MPKREEINVRFAELNNKSRKGEYIYLKFKGKPSRSYKYKGEPLDIFVNYYKKRYVDNRPIGSFKKYKGYILNKETKHKPKEKEYRSAIMYLRKLKKEGRLIEQEIRKGITETTIKDGLTAQTSDIKKAYEELFTPLVLDKDLLKLLITEENIKKLKNRFKIEGQLLSVNNSQIGNVRKMNMTIEEAIRELKEQIKIDEYIDKDEYINNNSPLGRLKQKEWIVGFRETGTLKNIQLKITFTKGK